jgi:hypothetical protein
MMGGHENPHQLQTMPAELDLWALNSVHPNAVGFNYFQAVRLGHVAETLTRSRLNTWWWQRDFALGEDADRPKYTNADLNNQLNATG